MPVRAPSARAETATGVPVGIFEELELLASALGRPFGQLARRVIEKL